MEPNEKYSIFIPTLYKNKFMKELSLLKSKSLKYNIDFSFTHFNDILLKDDKGEIISGIKYIISYSSEKEMGLFSEDVENFIQDWDEGYEEYTPPIQENTSPQIDIDEIPFASFADMCIVILTLVQTNKIDLIGEVLNKYEIFKNVLEKGSYFELYVRKYISGILTKTNIIGHQTLKSYVETESKAKKSLIPIMIESLQQYYETVIKLLDLEYKRIPLYSNEQEFYIYKDIGDVLEMIVLVKGVKSYKDKNGNNMVVYELVEQTYNTNIVHFCKRNTLILKRNKLYKIHCTISNKKDYAHPDDLKMISQTIIKNVSIMSSEVENNV